METTQNNRLIAEFMGYELEETLTDDTFVYAIPTINNNLDFFEPNELLYHTDWNWLMGVVKKINTSDYTVEIHSMDTRIYNNNTGIIIFESECKWQQDELLNSVYEAVIEFIKWYNENK